MLNLIGRTLLVGCLLSTLISCAGQGKMLVPGSNANGMGAMKIGVTWPVAGQSRLVPISSLSIKVQVFLDGVEVNSTIIPKPLTIANFSNVPTGNLTVVATAYPNLDGTGVAQATGTVPATVTSAVTTNVNLTMNSTITHIDVTPSPANLTSGQITTMVATPKDASNNVVLVSPANILFTSSNILVATVLPVTGVTTALLAGSATITATELESGVSGTATVNVAVGVSILPGNLSLNVLGIQLFVATVVGSLNTAVTWSVVEGSSGGSINIAGLYVAPLSPGTYHVKATSVADPTKSATVTVTVHAGNLGVSIN